MFGLTEFSADWRRACMPPINQSSANATTFNTIQVKTKSISLALVSYKCLTQARVVKGDYSGRETRTPPSHIPSIRRLVPYSLYDIAKKCPKTKIHVSQMFESLKIDEKAFCSNVEREHV